MTIERPLLEGSATDFESALLRSAAEEAPSAELSAKMLAPLALPAAASATTSGLTAMSAAKWGALALVTLAGVAALVGTADQAEPSKPPMSSSESTREGTSAPKPPPSQVKAPSVQGAEAHGPPPLEHQAARKEPDPAASAPTQKKRAPAVSNKGAPSELADEMRMLDQARAALARKDPKTALSVLAAYEEKHPQGALRPEATVLRVTALKDSGASAQADELKDAFLQAHPKSAHKNRLKKEEKGPAR